MTTPVSSVVTVSISTTPTGVSRAGFGTGLFYTYNTGVIPIYEGVRLYTSLTDVSAD